MNSARPGSGPGLEKTALLDAYRMFRLRLIGLPFAAAVGGYALAELRVAADWNTTVNTTMLVLTCLTLVPGVVLLIFRLALHGDAYAPGKWLRHFDAEPVTWEIGAVGTRQRHTVLKGPQGRMPVISPWRKSVLMRTPHHLLFAGDFRSGGVVITPDLRRFRFVRPLRYLPYATLEPPATKSRKTAVRFFTYPPPVVDARTLAAADRRYALPDGYTPPETVRLTQHDAKGQNLGDWRMDDSGIALDGPVSAVVTWNQLQEVAFTGDELHGRLRDPEDATGRLLGGSAAVAHPGYVLLGSFHGASERSAEDFGRRFAADLEHFARNADVRTLVPPTSAWVTREFPPPSLK